MQFFDQGEGWNTSFRKEIELVKPCFKPRKHIGEIEDSYKSAIWLFMRNHMEPLLEQLDAIENSSECVVSVMKGLNQGFSYFHPVPFSVSGLVL